MDKKDYTSLRQEYAGMPLLEEHAKPDPLLQFSQWFEQAVSAGLPEPNAMTLATISQRGTPTARVVLLKELDKKGFIFYTNYASNKGKELLNHPHAALVFLWLELQRQVRVEGQVHRISDSESDNYFASRPRDSQLGAIASPQSDEIPSKAYLAERFALLRNENEGRPVKRPEHWGGFRLVPARMEFWQGQPGRLHDRLLYINQGFTWQIKRLAP